MKHAVRAIVLVVLVSALIACGTRTKVTSGKKFDTTHAHQVQKGQDKAAILAWFGTPYKTTAMAQDALGCVERWQWQYGAIERDGWTGRMGQKIRAYALVVDFNLGGKVCNHAYSKR